MKKSFILLNIFAQEDKYQLVKLLLLNGADANSKIPNGWNVLMLAIRTALISLDFA